MGLFEGMLQSDTAPKNSRNQAHAEEGLDTHGLLKLGDAWQKVNDINEQVVSRLMQQTEGKAAAYQASNLTLNPGQPYNVLPFDLSRLKCRILAEGSGVQFGTLASVSGQAGYRLQPNASFELLTTDSVWLLNTSGAPIVVNVYEEKAAQ